MSQTRRFIQPYRVVEDGNMASNITSDSVDISNIDSVAIVYSWSGVSPSGTVFIEVKNGDSPWTTLTVSPLAVISSNTGANNFQLTELSFKELRVYYARTSGTGTLNAYLTAKGR